MSDDERIPSPEPDYFSIVSRETLQETAQRADALGALAAKMLSSIDERQVFRDGARNYIGKVGQNRRRFAITALAAGFGADRAQLKRLLRFWGIVGEKD